ncbi:MAG TPA: branched-chain amino acid ABC transporter permease [Acidimicrobiia bacterium]|nr:branched-chain amino acid ABC transporter permease [Acidimicrobiia bacterium]
MTAPVGTARSFRPQTVAVAIFAAGAVIWPFVLPGYTHFYGVLTVVYALVALSVTVLSGWAGQISLGQAAFLGIGVYAAQPLLARELPLPLVILAVGLLGAGVSLVLGVPSLRLRGVYLTVVTLAFGAACERFLFPMESISGGRTAKVVERPDLFGWSLSSDRDLYLAGLLTGALAFWLAANLRRSDAGRGLFAIRDSEEAAQSLGIRLAPSKIGAFAFSAALASVAGVFYAMLFNSTPASDQFGVLQSLFFLALPVVGGLEALAGAIIGGFVLAVAQPVVNALEVRLFFTAGVMLSVIVVARTGGVVGLVTGLWLSGRRQLARRPEPAEPVPVPAPRIRVSGGPLVDGTVVRLRFARRSAL